MWHQGPGQIDDFWFIDVEGSIVEIRACGIGPTPPSSSSRRCGPSSSRPPSRCPDRSRPQESDARAAVTAARDFSAERRRMLHRPHSLSPG